MKRSTVNTTMQLLSFLFIFVSIFIFHGHAFADSKVAESKIPATKWGAPITMKDARFLSEQLANVTDKSTGKSTGECLIKAQVEKVCQSKGCWMNLTDGKQSIRVTFKDYGFFVDKKLFGKTVLAQGNFQMKEISVKDQKHYLQDEGRPQTEIDQVTTPKVEISFIASGVELAADKN